jgi:hypothetical protein
MMIIIINGNKAMPHNKLLSDPFLFNPTLEKMSIKDRRFSQRTKKMTKKTIIGPQLISIALNKPKTREIVTSWGSVFPEDPVDNI